MNLSFHLPVTILEDLVAEMAIHETTNPERFSRLSKYEKSAPPGNEVTTIQGPHCKTLHDVKNMNYHCRRILF